MRGKSTGLKIRIALLLSSLLTVGISNNALAIAEFKIENMSSIELKSLPPYCAPKARKDGNNQRNPDVKRWGQVLGWENYLHIHHFCLALLQKQRIYSAKSQQERSSLLNNAINNINYSQRHSTKNFKLNAKMATTKGAVYILQGKDVEALLEYHRALTFNRDYVPAMFGAAKLHLKWKQYDEASSQIERALKIKPKSKRLKRLQQKIKKERIL